MESPQRPSSPPLLPLTANVAPLDACLPLLTGSDADFASDTPSPSERIITGPKPHLVVQAASPGLPSADVPTDFDSTQSTALLCKEERKAQKLAQMKLQFASLSGEWTSLPSRNSFVRENTNSLETSFAKTERPSSNRTPCEPGSVSERQERDSLPGGYSSWSSEQRIEYRRRQRLGMGATEPWNVYEDLPSSERIALRKKQRAALLSKQPSAPGGLTTVKKAT